MVKYLCELCNRKYNSEADAESCEKRPEYPQNLVNSLQGRLLLSREKTERIYLAGVYFKNKKTFISQPRKDKILQLPHEVILTPNPRFRIDFREGLFYIQGNNNWIINDCITLDMGIHRDESGNINIRKMIERYREGKITLADSQDLEALREFIISGAGNENFVDTFLDQFLRPIFREKGIAGSLPRKSLYTVGGLEKAITPGTPKEFLEAVELHEKLLPR